MATERQHAPPGAGCLDPRVGGYFAGAQLQLQRAVGSVARRWPGDLN